MSDDVKRPYRQGARAERAAATRAAIRAAATELFLANGYAVTTMRQIADAAGVGERTLYDAFPTKEAVFRHVAGTAIVGDEAPIPVSGRPEFRAVLAHTTVARVLASLADFAVDLLERAGPILMVAIESSGADEGMRRFVEEGEAATRANVTAVVDHLVQLGAVAGNRRAVASANTVIVGLVSPHLHHLLRRRGALSRREYRDWLERALHTVVTT